METKTALQSTTIRNSLVGLITSVGTLAGVFLGKSYDVEFVVNLVDQGWLVAPLAITAFTSFKSIVGRKKADTIIK